MTSASSSSERLLVVATLNAAKGRELRELLQGLPFDIRVLGEIPGATLPPETGSSYEENARLKARAAARLVGALALADDSGLEVDALGGAPGIHSARFGGAGLDDAGRCRLLLELMRYVPTGRRTARYRCVIAVCAPDGSEKLAEGVVEGAIADVARGQGGFGYDPVFFYPPRGRTFGELDPEEKSRVSHRARGVSAARRLLIG